MRDSAVLQETPAQPGWLLGRLGLRGLGGLYKCEPSLIPTPEPGAGLQSSSGWLLPS